MAVNIFDKYGIKEVANVYFEALEDDPRAGVYKGDVVLFLDTLKTSTIETSAEQTDARGGWGNPKLITWDYGKEITLTLTDALISLESLRFMLGGAIHKPEANAPVIVRHTEEVIAYKDGTETDDIYVPLPKDHLTNVTLTPKATVGHPIRLINLTKGYRTQIVATSGETAMSANGTKVLFKNPAAGIASAGELPAVGDHIRIFWEEVITPSSTAETAVEVTISPDTFPGTYRVVGDTFMRSADTGKDEAFQFVINKAKVASNVTITLEAEGDPSTFEMQLTVLRSNNERGENEMMKLIRYAISESSSGSSADDYGELTAKGSL